MANKGEVKKKVGKAAKTNKPGKAVKTKASQAKPKVKTQKKPAKIGKTLPIRMPNTIIAMNALLVMLMSKVLKNLFPSHLELVDNGLQPLRQF